MYLPLAFKEVERLRIDLLRVEKAATRRDDDQNNDTKVLAMTTEKLLMAEDSLPLLQETTKQGQKKHWLV